MDDGRDIHQVDAQHALLQSKVQSVRKCAGFGCTLPLHPHTGILKDASGNPLCFGESGRIESRQGYPPSLSVWRTPIEGGLEAKVLDRVVDWTVAKAGIYFIAPPDQQRRHNICFQEFASGKIRTIGTTDRPISIGMAVSPDSRTLLYSQWDEYGSDLMLVPNFR